MTDQAGRVGEAEATGGGPPVEGETEREPFIPYADAEHLRPDLKNLLDQYVERMGFLPNALKLYLHRPHLLKVIISMNNSVMRHDSNVLSEEFKYRMAFIVSRNHGCRYCCAHHANTLRRKFGYQDRDIDGVLHMREPRDQREAVAWEFVDRGSRSTHLVTDDLRERLARHFTPEEVIEISCVLGFWAFYNRIHANLAVPIEQHLIADQHWVDVGRDGG